MAGTCISQFGSHDYWRKALRAGPPNTWLLVRNITLPCKGKNTAGCDLTDGSACRRHELERLADRTCNRGLVRVGTSSTLRTGEHFAQRKIRHYMKDTPEICLDRALNPRAYFHTIARFPSRGVIGITLSPKSGHQSAGLG